MSKEVSISKKTKTKTNGEGHDKPSKRFPYSEINKILIKLRENDFDYTKTAAETGIHRTTLSRWRHNFPEMCTNKYHAMNVANLENKIYTNNKEVVETAFSLLKKCMDRADKLVAQEEDLNKISNLIKVLSPISEMNKEGEQEEKETKMSVLKKTLEKMSELDITEATIIP